MSAMSLMWKRNSSLRAQLGLLYRHGTMLQCRNKSPTILVSQQTVAASNSSLVRVNIQDDIAVLQMFSADNKWNLNFVNDFEKALDQVESNPSIKGMVLTGQGKFFLFGLDLPWVAQQPTEILAQFLAKTGEIDRRLVEFPMPTVAAINGHAFGQGAIVSLACDYRVMRHGRGWWCLPETKLNLNHSGRALALITSKLSRAETVRDASMFSKRYAADAALAAGIVDEAVEESQLIPAGIRYCNQIVGDGIEREVVRHVKQRLYGNAMRAAAERDRQALSPGEKEAQIQAYKDGAKFMPSKM